MYQDKWFLWDHDRLVYYPPRNATPLFWFSAVSMCRLKWGRMFVPRNETDLEWMKAVYTRMNYREMWMPLKENKDAEGTYAWAGSVAGKMELVFFSFSFLS